MNKKGRESGQTLLIVIFAITLGLVALVGVSTRIVSSTKRVFIDNAYYKAQAVAEAGAEKFLQKSNSELKTLVDDNTCQPSALYTPTGFAASIPVACTLDMADGFTEARAVMAVETYPTSGNTYDVSSPANSTISINLIGAASSSNVRVCWQGTSVAGPAYAEILSFYYSRSGGTYKLTQQKHTCYEFVGSWCSSPAWYSASDGIEDTMASIDYSCFYVPVTTGPQLLNLMSLVNGSSYQITFTGNVSVPAQGYKITSVGEVKSGLTGGGSLAGSTATRKKVVVEKSRMPNLGPWFDFAVASESNKIVAE